MSAITAPLDRQPDFSLYQPQEKSRVWEIAYLVISIVIPIIGFIRLCDYGLHWLGGRMLIQATSYLRKTDEEYQQLREAAGGEELCIETEDGVHLSALVVRPDVETTEWTVCFNPTSCVYEDFLAEGGAPVLVKEMKSNLLLFNYRGTLGSEGRVSRDGILKDGEAIFRYMEQSGATKITYWGLSLGGAVSSVAMSQHEEKEGVEYVNINERSFTKFSLGAGRTVRIILQQYLWKPIAHAISYIVPSIVRLSGWEMDAEAAWHKLSHCKLVVYHKWDEMMDHESGLGYALEGQIDEKHLLVLGDDDGPMDWWNHVPKFPEDAHKVIAKLHNVN